jgi:hypothetical protein
VWIEDDDPNTAPGAKIIFLKIQDGGGGHLGFCSNCYRLVTVYPIDLKFGMGLQDDDAHVTCGPKVSLSVIQDGGGGHLGFCFNC